MSMITWKEEFMPVWVVDTKPEEALDHSLRKWKGLTPENLAKHGLWKKNPIELIDENGTILTTNGSSCALCRHFKCANDLDYPHKPKCPLGDCTEEWLKWAPTKWVNEPQDGYTAYPMIALIEQAIGTRDKENSHVTTNLEG